MCALENSPKIDTIRGDAPSPRHRHPTYVPEDTSGGALCEALLTRGHGLAPDVALIILDIHTLHELCPAHESDIGTTGKRDGSEGESRADERRCARAELGRALGQVCGTQRNGERDGDSTDIALRLFACRGR